MNNTKTNPNTVVREDDTVKERTSSDTEEETPEQKQKRLRPYAPNRGYNNAMNDWNESYENNCIIT